MCVAVHKINFIRIGYNPKKLKKDSYMADALCCSMYWLGLHNKNSNFMPALKQFGRAGKHWISSISTTPLHYLTIDHDVGRWGTYFEYF